MPSAAFRKFAERMLEVKRLLSLCAPEDADYRIKKENVARDEALLRGAHVLLCSHLEGYFEDLICDLIQAYDNLTTQVTQLPEELRARQVMGEASKWEIKDPIKRWIAIQAWASHPLVNDGCKKAPGCMEAALHTKGFSNPGTNEIEYLFKSVGIDDVWSQFKAIEPDQLISQSVDIIVNRRNQIAHGKADATITLADARNYVERAERLADVFEQLVTMEINIRLSLPDCWQALEDTGHIAE
jgi:RiboL-PSP-HEPN